MANTEYKFVDHYEFDEELLKKAFAEAKAILKSRGFMREMGWGKAPAITTVDMAKAWMSEGHPFTCDHSEEVCANDTENPGGSSKGWSSYLPYNYRFYRKDTVGSAKMG